MGAPFASTTRPSIAPAGMSSSSTTPSSDGSAPLNSRAHEAARLDADFDGRRAVRDERSYQSVRPRDGRAGDKDRRAREPACTSPTTRPRIVGRAGSTNCADATDASAAGTISRRRDAVAVVRRRPPT